MNRYLVIAGMAAAAFVLFRVANIRRDGEVIAAGDENAAVNGSTFTTPIASTSEGVDFADFFDPPVSSPGGAGSGAGIVATPAPAPQPQQDFSSVGL